MTKADLIAGVSRSVGMTQQDSIVIVDTIFESIVKALQASERIEIRGFGSFRTRQRQPRIGRNPKTGARVEVPSKSSLGVPGLKEGSVVISTAIIWSPLRLR